MRDECGTCGKSKAERDEIVLALRVLRVLRHPWCQNLRFDASGTFSFQIDGGEIDDYPRWMPLDDAERLLGIEQDK